MDKEVESRNALYFFCRIYPELTDHGIRARIRSVPGDVGDMRNDLALEVGTLVS